MEQAYSLQAYHLVAQEMETQPQAMPFECYRSDEIAAVETEKVFSGDWVFACADAALSEPGDFYAFKLGMEPVVLIRQKDGTLKALSNVCRHRGTPILDEGFGKQAKLVCPYHAWTYSLDGRLKGIPFAGDGEVDKNQISLSAFAHEVWRGLIFVALQMPDTSVAKRLENLEWLFDSFDTDRFTQVSDPVTETWEANWKLAMENAMESYHLFKVHRDTLETITPTKDALYVQGQDHWSLTAGKMIGSDSFLSRLFAVDHDEIYKYYFLIMLPPNFVGILTYESFDWISVLPKTASSCQVMSSGISSAQSPSDRASIDFVKQFFAEDKAICERVQRGMQARQTRGGPLLEVERIVADFHRYLVRQILHVESSTNHVNEQALKSLGLDSSGS